MIEDRIKDLIKKSLGDISVNVKESEIHVEHPADILHGDFSTNIAMVLGKKNSQNPKELAEKIVNGLNNIKSDEILNVEVAGAGFINFFLSESFFTKSIKDILSSKGNYGMNEELKGKKIMVEYTNPNLFKEFHIGHLMNNTIGESLSRIFEFSGAEVKRANYQGDVGMHVAKAVYGIIQNEKDIPNDDDSLDKKAKFLGMSYSFGAKAYEESGDAKEKIKEINKYIYENRGGKIMEIYKKGREWSLAYFEEIYKRLGTSFDYYFFESEVSDIGKKLVEDNIGSVFEKSDGAIIFSGEKYGLHTRVFINSEGLPVYEGKEIALPKIKFDKYPYDTSFVVTGNDIKEYFKVIIKALEFIYKDLALKTIHISHGMLRLPSGKMSSRTGDVISAESLIDKVVTEVKKIMKDSGIDADEKEQIADKIAIGALKYSILKQSTDKDIIFDFDRSLSFEGNSGPYLQYTYVRAMSILKKAEKEKIKISTHSPLPSGGIEKLLYRFTEVVNRAQSEREPHHVATYLFELASSFNNYYAKEKILGGLGESYRLALTESVSIVLKNGLYLLGIKSPEKM